MAQGPVKQAGPLARLLEVSGEHGDRLKLQCWGGPGQAESPWGQPTRGSHLKALRQGTPKKVVLVALFCPLSCPGGSLDGAPESAICAWARWGVDMTKEDSACTQSFRENISDQTKTTRYVTGEPRILTQWPCCDPWADRRKGVEGKYVCGWEADLPLARPCGNCETRV